MNALSSLPSFSTQMCAHLESLAKKIESEAIPSEVTSEMGYLETLQAIYTISQPLFNQIASLAENAGFEKVEAFEAWPKGLCENFVFGVVDAGNGKITHVILAKNKKYQFLQNGGGKTTSKESSEQAAFREAQEEFSFDGQKEQIKRITIESESGAPSFNFVKGVHIALITPEQASKLKLADDMASNEITSLSVEEFLRITDADTKPIDHGFDRKWIAEYVRSMNSGALQHSLKYNERQITEEDQLIAAKALEWMNKIHVNKNHFYPIKDLIQQASQINFSELSQAEGAWKSDKNREIIKKSAQKVIDAIVKKLLPEWKYAGKKGEEKACQVKVQEAVGILVNGDPLPSFLTIPQMAALQSGLLKGNKVEWVSIANEGDCRNITTLSK
jgi:8-oxo-dGTP pyrophosphatase MutT (NUDIX family)